MNKYAAGFTLIELLITISIIAMLSAVGLTVYSEALRTNRDQVRLKHLNDLKITLDTYRYDHHQYPTTAAVDTELSALISKTPVDPLSPAQAYVYQALPA